VINLKEAKGHSLLLRTWVPIQTRLQKATFRSTTKKRSSGKVSKPNVLQGGTSFITNQKEVKRKLEGSALPRGE